MASFLSRLSAASVVIDGNTYPLNDYPTTLIDDLRGRLGNNVVAIIEELQQSGYNPDSAPDHIDPMIADWPEAYVEALREEELWEAPDEQVLEVLSTDHTDMRFGQSIDLNIQHGFYFNPGNGQITIGQGSDSGHLIEVMDSPDTIDITMDGDIRCSTSEVADWYVRDAAEKVRWVFESAKGPWLLTADYHERKGYEFYFLVVRFLSVEDDAAFIAAFPEARA